MQETELSKSFQIIWITKGNEGGGDSVQKIAWNMEAQSPGFGISL